MNVDEEKKEYEELKSLLYTGTISQYGKRKLIDIIEKQQKEIEELKEDKYGLEEEVQIQAKQLIEIDGNYISKEESEQKEKKAYIDGTNVAHELCNKKWEDIIKAKIEPVLKQLERKMQEEYNKYGNSREYQDIVDAYNFLQSLLEKE